MEIHESFDQGLFDGLTEEPASRKTKKEFKPWHNPRKQLVRKEQWIYFTSKYLANILSGRTTLKYFSLPGDDLLDVRVFHDSICEPKKIQLNFVGFNDHTSDPEREQDANLSLAEVRAMPFIDKESVYHENNVLHVGVFRSLAYTRMKDHGDYDVINLDFCDSITSCDPTKNEESHYHLLKNVINIQRSRDEPWLLFITTRVGSDHIQSDVLELLTSCYEANLEDDNFKNESINKYGISNSAELNQALTKPDLFNKLICISICKWLLSQALSSKPQVTVKVLDAMEYKVNPNAPHADMISFALYFVPHPDKDSDKIGLAPVMKQHQKFKEPEVSIPYLHRFSVTTNCDEWLMEDTSKKEAVIDESLQLLDSARYDTTFYVANFS